MNLLKKGLLLLSRFYNFSTLIILVALIARLLLLNRFDVWFDEAFSILVAKQSISNILIAVLADNHPPLYFFILHFWAKLFGINQVFLRLLSSIFGLVSMIVFYRLTELMFDKRLLRNISLTLFSFSPLIIYYDIQARMYSLFVLLTLLSVYFFLKLLKKISLLNGTAFFIFITLSVFTHYYGLLLLLTLSLIALLKKKVILVPLLFSLAVSFALVISFINNASHPSFIQQPFWIALSASLFSYILGGTGQITLRSYFASTIPLFIKLFFILSSSFFIILSILGVKKFWKDKLRINIVYIFYLPLVFLSFFSLFLPLFSPRATIFLAPYFFILVVAGFPKIFIKNGVFLIPGILLVLNSILLIYPFFYSSSLKKAFEQTPQDVTTLHTSILSYYSSLIYQNGNQNSLLIGTNPLNIKTIQIISGKTSNIPKNKDRMVLLDVENGIDPKERLQIINHLNRDYLLTKKQVFGTVTIYFFQKPSIN